MKWLEAKALAPAEENKMQPGSRIDQRGGTSATPSTSTSAPTTSASVQKLADELGIDLRTVTGTGRGGTITTTDVRRAAQQRDDPSGV